MHLARPTIERRAARPLAAAVLVAVLCSSLAGCGGDDKDSSTAGKSATSSPSRGASLGAAGGPSANPTGIVSAPSDINRKTKPTTTAVPVPSDGPTGIGTFPVPPGVNIKGPGPARKAWQFDITTKKVASVLAFYRKALPSAGYQVQNNVTENDGAEVVKYDIKFTGKANGFIIGDQSQDDVFVVVQSTPAS